jgi:hypothetical protein
VVFALIILSIFLVSSLYVNYNLYKKYDKLEELSLNLEEVARNNEEFIIAIRNRIMSQQSYLRQLDRKGAFESDDEVGYFFKELKKIVNDISINLNIEPTESTEQNDSLNGEENRSFITSRF